MVVQRSDARLIIISSRLIKPQDIGLQAYISSISSGRTPPHVPATNRLTVELGAWYYKHLRQSRTILTLPWNGLESVPKPAPKPKVLRGDPRARARELQAMLDAGEVKNKADLARRLGLSRARITQILKHATSQTE